MLANSLLRHSARSNPLPALARQASVWSHVKQGPPDSILGLTVAFRADPNPKKVNLGVGAYRDADGKPFLLESVKEAQRRIVERNSNMEYAGIDGVPEFVTAAQKLTFGADHPLLKNDLVASTQTISGTGALRVAGEFLAKHLPEDSSRTVFLPSPTWANHNAVFKTCGLEVGAYRYYDKANNALDYDGAIEDIKKAPARSVILLHACAHNPTGVDPTPEQWKGISDACKSRNHILLVDSAYQGFTSGDPLKDSASYRSLVEAGHNILLCQSFAKNMGLYGQRTGCLHMVCSSKEEKEAVLSQLKLVVRPMYSNPPIHGARIVAEVLNDEQLSAKWRDEIQLMANRIRGMREALVSELAKAGSKKNWSHVTSQQGMFCYTGLSKDQVDLIKTKHSIYMTGDGRISLAGVTPGNVAYLAQAMHDVCQ